MRSGTPDHPARKITRVGRRAVSVMSSRAMREQRRRRDRRRRPQRPRRRDLARARGAIGARARAPRRARRRGGLRRRRSRASTCGSRATRTWSACSRPRSRDELGLRRRAACARRVVSYTPRRRRRAARRRDDERDAPSLTRVTGDADAFDAWERFYASIGGVARRLFPTLTEPLRSRDEMPRAGRRRRGLGGAVRGAAVGDCSSGRSRPICVRGVVLTDAMIGTFAAGRRPGAAPEPLLPLPRDRQRDRRLGRAGRRHGRAAASAGRRRAAGRRARCGPAPR